MDDEYNRDGGVTVMLRYTLRLLTTQQRDRITKMVLAAEMIRRQAYPQFGKEPISIGFWVGGGVTPNKFDEFIEKADNPQDCKKRKKPCLQAAPYLPILWQAAQRGKLQYRYGQEVYRDFLL